MTIQSQKNYQSLPLRECGLKFCNSVYLTLIVCHSPCGSVDWNNCRYKHRYKHRYSHSPCGSVDWNIVIPNKIQLVVVTPLAGVWIEIFVLLLQKMTCYSHSPCGSVDWNHCGLTEKKSAISHSPCGSVDWNTVATCQIFSWRSHSPCGSVDWNIYCITSLSARAVTPLAGVWIEIIDTFWVVSSKIVTPLAGVWIEIPL